MSKTPKRRASAPPTLSELVAATQAELGATAQALRGHSHRLGVLRRQLRARIPVRRFARAVETNQHTQVTALTASLDAHLADTLAPAIADLEASARATEAEPFRRPQSHGEVLVELLGRRDSLVKSLIARKAQGRQAARASRPHLPPLEKESS